MNLEVLVPGMPVSAGASRGSRERWQQAIRERVAPIIDGEANLIEGPVHATVIIFSDEELDGDLDNRLKRIFDALVGLAYVDDSQIETIHAHRYEPGRVRIFDNPSKVLINSIEFDGTCAYIRIEERP